jgi:hypothetical protein
VTNSKGIAAEINAEKEARLENVIDRSKKKAKQLCICNRRASSSYLCSGTFAHFEAIRHRHLDHPMR